MIHTISVQTAQKEVLVEITREVRNIAQGSGVKDGICCIYTPHTTAAVTINENADFSVSRDIIKGLAALELEQLSFAHGEGNSPAHIKSSLVGCSETVFLEAGKLLLGRWQGIFLCEFDGPRTRTVMVKIM
jgi:secondary thiamine-phosphate synthase enzyme